MLYYNKQCGSTCPNGKFPDVINNICASCDSTCSTCFAGGPNSCNSCSTGRFLKGTTC